MIQDYLRATFLIFMAEMGDKTQILAMTFATRFAVGQVLLGVGIGSLLNHGLAVLLGTLLATVIPLTMLRLVAAISFLGFGLWTLTASADDE
ncbi:MAG: TMEM165/GDT1 family protein [Firmicutes bacterium]|nr:TMEM165/GDT1 family protein [Bacillota bacterium]